MKGICCILLAAASVTAGAAELPVGDALTDARNPVVTAFKGQRLDLWSLRPVPQAVPPQPRNQAWVRNPVDAFILHGLEAAGLQPAPEADRRVLGRRLWHDLTGLPPSPDALDQFLRDADPDAYGRLVDRLLNSRAFAEHWARLWLDVVRYSDSNGYDWDEFRPEAWRFRDYVIRSLAADKPFDRFVREQLAGDEMLTGPPQNESEQDSLVATGYLRLGPYDHSSKLFNEQPKNLAAVQADVTETTAAAFLGLTLNCCRCHDHKTEPLLQTDHYRMRAFFANVRHDEAVPLDLAPARREIESCNAELDRKLKPLQQALENVGTDKARKEQLEREVQELNRQRRRFVPGFCGSENGAEAPETRVLEAGDPARPKQVVHPGVPAVFDPNDTAVVKLPCSSGRRTALAAWITAPENPLTSRVVTNRLWQGVFGTGIVATPNDFGFSGARPSHPALLDWLAQDFVRNGWSWKKTIRRLVTSATYRQSAYPGDARRAAGEAADAANTLLWRANPRRLTAEMLRDALLAVSGKLEPSDGGPAAWPPLPAEVLHANPAFADDNAEKTKGWYPSPPDKLQVRSIYTIQKRSVRQPFLETFDLPENFATCGRRAVSTVAPQALTLLNSTFTEECAAAFAERVRHAAGENGVRQIEEAVRLAVQRPPTPEEAGILLRLLDARDLVHVCRVLLNWNEFLCVD